MYPLVLYRKVFGKDVSGLPVRMAVHNMVHSLAQRIVPPVDGHAVHSADVSHLWEFGSFEDLSGRLVVFAY